MRLPGIAIIAFFLGLAHGNNQSLWALNVGDTAPPLKVAHWVKGAKVEKLNPERIYVIEFWATWCGYCRESIPHLTELDHQFRSQGVTFLGVAVWETDSKEVKPAVEKMGVKMSYSVAVDSVPPEADPHDGVMSKSWLNAAGEHSIPVVFVVKDDKIVWIGHPSNLEKPLAAIVAGTWDTAAFAKQREARKIVERKTRNINEHAVPLFKAKKYHEFLKSLEKITAGNEAVAKNFAGLKMAAICNSGDVDEGLELGTKFLEEHRDEPNLLNAFFWPAINPENNDKPDPRVVALALKAAKRAVTLTKEKNPTQLDTLALAQFLSEHPAAAVASEEKAIKALEPDAEHLKKLFNERLKRYRKAADAKKRNSAGPAK